MIKKGDCNSTAHNNEKDKIYVLIFILLLSSGWGNPQGLKARTSQEVNCESALKDYSKYIKLDNLTTTSDEKSTCLLVKVNNRTVGTYYGNMSTVTSELTDLFTNYRIVNATSTLEDIFEYGKHLVNIKYISGLEHGFNLDKKYSNFDKLSNSYLEKMNLLIIEQLNTYTNLRDN